MLTYTPLATTTVGAGGTSSITFNSIPATYTDLEIRLSLRNSTAANDNDLRININGTGIGNAFSQRFMQGTGVSTSSSTGTVSGVIVGGLNAGNNTANIFTNIKIYFFDYAASTYKTYLVHSAMENNATTAYGEYHGVMWDNTAAISSLSFTSSSGNWAEYSTATLYGIRNIA